MTKRLVAGLLLLLVAGCSRPLPPPPEPTPTPEPTAPVQLTLTPEAATPGATITATLQFQEPERLDHRDPDGSFMAWICFASCDGRGASTSLIFRPLPADPRRFTASFTVPLVLRRTEYEPVVAGEYQIHAACVVDRTGGCADRSDVSTTLRLSTGLESVAWRDLPAAEAIPVPRLGEKSAVSRSPVPGSQRSVECVAGNLYPQTGEAEPMLLRTDDAGRPRAPIVIHEGGPLVGRHGNARCGDLALDPAHPESFYLMEAPHAGGSERAVFPLPYQTMDGGATWAPLPAPTGFDASRSFVGFSVTPEGVTAWFSLARLEAPNPIGEQIRGNFTADGGRTWQTVEPGCPSGSLPCLWQVRELGLLRDGLIRSTDAGKSWAWVTLGSTPFAVDGAYVLDSSKGVVLEAVGGSPAFYGGLIPLLRSEDGGASWRWVEVPPPPEGWTEIPGAGLVLRQAPDGALLLARPDPESPTYWRPLPRGSSEWGSPRLQRRP